MHTRSSAVAAAVAECGWLAALVVAPLFFNPLTERIFEEEKVYLLRSIALLVAPALLLWTIEQSGTTLRRGVRLMGRLPLVRPALALTSVYVVATVVSVYPSASFWGAYLRTQGTYTWLSYIVVFAAIVLLVRQREQVERIVSAILLASIPATVYSIVQQFGYDPVVWDHPALEELLAKDPLLRSHSTAGNPIFLAAYLIMVMPLTLVRIAEESSRSRRLFRTNVPLHRQLSSALLLGCYVLLAALQVLGIVYSMSRGPFIGLCTGLVFFTIVLSVHRGWRWLSAWTAVITGAGVLFLFVLNLPDTPLASFHRIPYVGRLGRLAGAEDGTGRVRILIWQGAVDLLGARPERLLLGHGPETMLWVLPPFVPPELARLEPRGTSPDRAHNETFDALITTGVAGFLAQLAVLLSFFVCGLRGLGIIATRHQVAGALATAGLGGALGAVLPSLAAGHLWTAGVGFPAGIAVGFLAYLLWHGLRGAGPRGRNPRPGDLLLMGLMAAVMAHFVETQLGIAITVTRLYFWAYAALAVVMGVPLLVCVTRETKGAVPVPADARPGVSGSFVAVCMTGCLILVLLTFDFYRAELQVARHGWALAAILGGPWIVGGLLGMVETDSPRGALARLGSYVACTAGGWLLFDVFFFPWANWMPTIRELDPQIVAMLAMHQSRGVAILYAAVFLLLFPGALALALRDRPFATKLCRRRWSLGLAPGLLVLTAFLILRTNLDASQADTFSKQGGYYEHIDRWDAAVLVYRGALQRRPREEVYLTTLGRALVERARLGGPTLRKDLGEAVAAMERAQEINPLNVDHPRNLGRAHRTWARLSTQLEARNRHIEQADAFYLRAVTITPHNVSLWNERATLHLETGQTERALELLDRSIEVDPAHAATYWLRANAHLIAGDLETALRSYDETLAIDPSFLAAMSGKTVTQHRMGRLSDAIRTAQEAIALMPNDMLSRRNLALLYIYAGRPQLALRQAERALRFADVADRPPIEELVVELRRSLRKDGDAVAGAYGSPPVRTSLGLRSHARPVKIPGAPKARMIRPENPEPRS